ncbi:hypothetical protein K3495_g1200 [Podosphaera aphanis]|nr:hypothetical protein K3495_g1200 [Podosphaera aphanis]
MDRPQTPSPAARQYDKRLTRDQCLQVKTLSRAGFPHKNIAEQLGITTRQVSCTLKKTRLTPHKPKGRKPTLSSGQIDEVEDFICSSPENRQMSYFKFAHSVFPYLGVGEDVIRNEMKKRGFSRQIAPPKPLLNSENKAKRRHFARDHLHWTVNDWMNVLWTDETWVTDGRHTRCWVTRKEDERYEETCILDNIRRRVGWMFWASFFGNEKGPSLFWEKEWGSITSSSYSDRIVPLIHDMVTSEPRLSVLQDNAPPHKAARTTEEFREKEQSRRLNGLRSPQTLTQSKLCGTW